MMTNQEYYTLPLSVETLMRMGQHPKCSLLQSVLQHLHLLVTTATGEFRADEDFGCGIWDYDFDNITAANRIREIIRQSLLQTIQLKERRLGNVRLELLWRQEETPSSRGRNVRKKVDITVTGTLQLTNEKISFRDSFFVGPLSY
jgi:phage baseplate assembly protein W